MELLKKILTIFLAIIILAACVKVLTLAIGIIFKIIVAFIFIAVVILIASWLYEKIFR